MVTMVTVSMDLVNDFEILAPALSQDSSQGLYYIFFIYKLFIQDPIHYLPILVLAPTVAKVGAPIPRHFIWFIQTIDIYVDQYPDK